MTNKEKLLQPIKVGPLTSPNRFFIQAMECADADPDGNPSDLTYERYENLFKGESGFIDLEAISVTDVSRSRDDQLMIMPQNAKPLKDFVTHMKKINPNNILVFQLTHSGELSHPSFSRRVTVKPLEGYGGELLTEEEVDQVIEKFVQASVIAYEAGADGVDMKLCHGYFGSQVLRPYNDRDWKYGGSWENRRQFAFDLYDRIREAIPDPNFIIGSKISAWEGFPGGFGSAGPRSPVIDLTEPLDLIKGLEERGASYIIQSGGSPSITVSLTQVIKQVPYYAYLHMHWANEFKKVLKDETVVIGSNFSVFRNGKNGLQAVTEEESSLINFGAQCIDENIVDMIGLGRQSFADPFLAKKLREGQENDIKYCTMCDNCLELLIQQAPIGCTTYNKYYTKVLQDTRKEKGRLKQKHT